MRTSLKPVVLCMIVSYAMASAYARDMALNSIERWAQISDVIFVGRVESIGPSDSDTPGRMVTCVNQSALKGERASAGVEWQEDVGIAATVQTGDVVVIFIYEAELSNERWLFWLKTQIPSRIDPRAARVVFHYPFDDVGTLRSNATDVVTLVQSGLTTDSGGGTSRRGVLRRFGYAGSSGYLICSARPEYRGLWASESTNESWYIRSVAMFNLAAYSDTSTVSLIQRCLDDPGQQRVYNYAGEGSDISYYPVRQAAYLALLERGIHSREPEPYYPKVLPPGFDMFGDYRCVIPPISGSSRLFRLMESVRKGSAERAPTGSADGTARGVKEK